MATRPITVSRRPLTETEAVAARRPLGPSVKDNLPTSAISKSHLKLEDKLTKAEARIRDLLSDRATIHNEVGDLQTELRLAAQREAKLKLTVEKWEKSHLTLKEKTTKLSTIQGRLDELNKAHEESKTKRQREIDELNDKLKRADERRRQEVNEARRASEVEKTRAEENEAKTKVIEQRIIALQNRASGSAEETQKTIQKLQSEKDSIKVALMDAQMYAKQTESKMQQQIDLLQQQLEQRKLTLVENAQKEARDIEAARAQLLIQVQELTQDIDELETNHARNLTSIAKATHLHLNKVQEENSQKRWSLQQALHNAIMGNMLARSNAAEQEAELKKLTSTIKHLEKQKDEAHLLASALQRDLDASMAELEAERVLAMTLAEQHSETGDDFEFLSVPAARDDEELRLLLEVANSRYETLDRELQDLHIRYIVNAKEFKATIAALEASQGQVTQLESTLAAKAADVDRLKLQVAEMESLRDQLQAARDETAVASREARASNDAVKSVSASLQNSRIAEQAWREERDQLAVMLDEASKYQDLYNDLSSQTRHLIERNALAEQEKATLSALNSELLGHTNPNQKIMYMDRVRRELDEVKEDNISLRIQLENMTNAKLTMEKELRSYKAVDVPLNQRPRTELTRVVRASDHDALLRSVSSRLDRTEAVPAIHSPSIVEVQPLEIENVKEDVRVPESKPLKKRRSYGNISVHAAALPVELEVVSDDDSEDDETVEAVPKPGVVSRNRSRTTLINSGSLRNPSNAPPTDVTVSAVETLPALVEQTDVCSSDPHDPTQTCVAIASLIGKTVSKPSLGVSSLGIKARRVSELVRASSPPLPMISDVSNDAPNLMNAALPSPSPHIMADWTMDTPGSGPMPLLRGDFGPGAYGAAHSTPLARSSPRKPILHTGPEEVRPRALRRSRYSGAQRVAAPQSGLRNMNGRTSLMIREENGEESTIYEDQDDSLRQGWHDDGTDTYKLPDFNIDGVTSVPTAPQQPKALPRKSKSSKARPSASKLVKPGPMARSIFR